MLTSIFDDSSSNLLFVLWLLILIFIVTFLLSVIVVFFYSIIVKKRNSYLSFSASNVRIYSLDFSNNNIRYFDKQNMRKQIVTTFDAFIRGFNPSDAERFRNWIQSYTQGDANSPSFLTMSTHIHITGQDCLSVYRITNFNAKAHILHFENTLLPGISTKVNKRLNRNYIKNLSDIQNMLAAHPHKYKHCLCVYIKIIPIVASSYEQDLRDERTSSMPSIYQPLNLVEKYLSKTRNLAFINDDEAVICDFNITYRADVISLCNLLLSEIERYFTIKALDTLYDVAIGSAMIDAPTPERLLDNVEKARKFAEIAAEKDDTKYVIEGIPEADSVPLDSAAIGTEIESLIKNNTYRCYFTPVLSQEALVSYYLVDINPYGTSLSTFYELVTASDRHHLLPDLLASVLSSINSSLDSYQRVKLIFRFPYNKLGALVDALRTDTRLKDSLYVCLDKSELQNFFEADADLSKTFNLLTSERISTCLNFENSSIDTPKDILSRFDIYIISVGNHQGLHGNEAKTSQLISMNTVLSSYGKPIIVDDLQSLADMELAYQLGYRSFVCTSVAGISSSTYVPDDSWRRDVIPKGANDTSEIGLSNLKTGLLR